MIGIVTTTVARSHVDLENPWPALESFGEADSAFFFGRETSIDALLQIIGREDRILLYGSSGLGKTSLLRAGVFPRLPPTIMPVYIRLRYDHSEGYDLTRQVLDAVIAETIAQDVEAPPLAPSGTLWEYFRRRDHPFWAPGNQMVIPLLVFDQFEQLFTRNLTSSIPQEQIDAFIQDLGDLISGRAPAWLGKDIDTAESRRYIFESPGCKVIFSFREDFLADVKRLDALIPTLDRNALRLEPMRWTDAARAVRLAGDRLLEPAPSSRSGEEANDVAASIADIVAGRGVDRAHATIEPSILSVFCTELNEERKARAARGEPALIDMSLVSGRDASEIIAGFYRRCVAQAPASTRQLIENRLILPSGARDSVALETVPEADRAAIDTLINKWRILRLEAVGHQKQVRLELTHDVLVRPALEDRRAREELDARNREIATHVQQERDEQARIRQRLEQENRERQLIEEQARRTKRWLKAAVLLAISSLAAAIAAGWSWREARAQRQLAEARALDRDVTQAFDTSRGERTGEGLAQLAALIRHHPENERARALMFNLLLSRSWWLPLATTKLSGSATTADFSPDGTLAVTGSADGLGRIWRAATGEPVADFRHESRISTAMFSPDSRFVLTASADSTARVWDARTGHLVATLRHEAPVNTAVFSPDGRLAVTASEDTSAVLWSASTWKKQATVAHGDVVVAARFSPDSKRMVTASFDRTARVWNAISGQPMSAPLVHAGRVLDAAFNSYGEWLATASDDGTARVWRASVASYTPAPQVLAELAASEDKCRSVEFSADGLHLLTLHGSAPRIWNLTALAGTAPGRHPVSFVALRHPEAVSSAAFDSNGHHVITAAVDGIARIWDTYTGAWERSLTTPFPMSSARIDVDGSYITTAGDDGTGTSWALESAAAPTLTLDPGSRTAIAAFSPDGRTVLTTAIDGAVDLWDAASGQRQPLHGAPIDGVSAHLAEFADNDRLLVVSGNTVQVWRRKNGAWALGARTQAQPNDITSAHFDPSGTRIVTASSGGGVRLWSAEDGSALAQPAAHAKLVWSVEFNFDGRSVVSASDDATVRVSDVATGRLVGNPLRHNSPVYVARFSNDGRRIVTGARDGRAAVWNVGIDHALRVLEHGGAVIWVQFSRDDVNVLTGSEDGTIRVWNATTGQPIARVRAHNGAIRAANLTADGRRVVSGGSDGKVRVWDAQTLEPQSDEFDAGDELVLARFDPDGDRVVVVTVNDRPARIIDFPRGTRDDAQWLADFAEHIGGMRAAESGVPSPLPAWLADLAAVRQAVRAPPAATETAQRHLEAWFFAPVATRPASPFGR